MSLAPLLTAAPAIPLHAFAAMAAFVLGLVQFAAPKGTLPHRTIGWIWVVLMAVVAASSFWTGRSARSMSCRSSRWWCCRSRYGGRTPIASPITG